MKKLNKTHRPFLGYVYLLLIGIIIGYLLPKNEKTQQIIDRLLRRSPSSTQQNKKTSSVPSPSPVNSTTQKNIPLEEFTGRVVRVSDGDTISVLITNQGKKKQERIRLYGIDAPESKQDFGQKSKATLSGFIFDREVTVKVHNRDQYGRIVGEIFYQGVLINLEMVRAGMAWHYAQYSPNEKEYAKAMNEAKEKKLGLWSHPTQQPPWEYRRLKKLRSLSGKEK